MGIMFVAPFWRAKSTTVLPRAFVHSGFAPLTKRSLTSSSLPELTAHMRAEPLSLCAFTSAPLETRYLAVSRLPPLAADISGFMSCMPAPFTSAPLFRSASQRARSPARAAWFRLSFPTKVHPAASNAKATTDEAEQMPGLRIRVTLMPNAQHQRWEPAAADTRKATDLKGWLSSAECCGSALSSRFLEHNVLRDIHLVQRDAPAGPKVHLYNVPRLFGCLLKRLDGARALLQ
jgi:hypothetical protein